MTDETRILWPPGTKLHVVLQQQGQIFHYRGELLRGDHDQIIIRDFHDGKERLLNLSFCIRVEVET